MATSGNYTYNPTAAIIISDALRLLGVLEEGNSATDTQVDDCMPSFEMYIKGLSKYGLNIWTINSVGEQETLVASTATYSTDNPALKMLECYFRDSDGNDTTLIPLARSEYWNLSDKDQAGQPTQFFFDPSNNSFTSGTVYLWPVPDSSNAGSGELLLMVYQHYIEDVDDYTVAGDPDGANELAIPQEWLETIKYGLATRLAPMYGYPVQERNLLLREYNGMLVENLAWDSEQESIYIQPDYDKATIG